MRLSEALNTIGYSTDWGIWAQKVEGKFHPESPARFRQMEWEDGGVLGDDWHFVCLCEFSSDFCAQWHGVDDLTDVEIDPAWEGEFLEKIHYEQLLARRKAREARLTELDNSLKEARSLAAQKAGIVLVPGSIVPDSVRKDPSVVEAKRAFYECFYDLQCINTAIIQERKTP